MGRMPGALAVAAKCALVVDDSKSARAFLARMLEKYELDVVSAESAEQAIEYLAHHRPDVIFMDHLMPGMDGFQAVQAIKNNPRTATIPIMMYTSQEGELYLGQARALGAVGVLPKQIKPADVSKVLYQLHLLPERRSGEQSAFQQLSGGPVEIDDGGASRPAAAPGRGLTEAAMREQIAELRRTLAASLESQAERLKADFDAALEQRAAAAAGRPSRRDRPWAAIAAALAGLIAVASLLIAAEQTVRTTALATEVAGLRSELQALAQDGTGSSDARSDAAAATLSQAGSGDGSAPADPAAASSSARAGSGGSADSAARKARGPAQATATAAAGGGPAMQPVVEVVPYGEDPFGGPRLDSMRQLFDRLIEQGYRGTVEVRVFPGRFCLMGNSTDGYSLAPDDMPYARCDLVGSSLPRDEAGSPRVSVAFADLAAELRSATRGAADVQVLAGDDHGALVAYPPISDNLTAGEWNRAAGANNRIEVRVR